MLLIALTAATVFAFAAGSASANRGLEVTPNRAILVIFPELTFGSPIGSIICSVTLHGSLHRTIPKVHRTLMGMVESVLIDIRNCVESFGVGNVTDVRVSGLPWHMVFLSFTGTLPNITQIAYLIIRPGYLIDFEIFGADARCRYTPEEQGARARVERGEIRTTEIIERRSRPDAGSTENCPEGGLRGTGTITPEVGTLRIRLI